jgi:hypothetical protein
MRKHMLWLALVAMSGCASSPLPQVDPNMAWIDLATPMPGGKLLMAESLDGFRRRWAGHAGRASRTTVLHARALRPF